MLQQPLAIKINPYLPFAMVYFFFNSLGLPFGLTYTAILAPYFYWWVLTVRGKDVLLQFIVVLSPFLIMQSWLSAPDPKTYIVSVLNIVLIYITAQSVYTFLISSTQPEKIFYRLLQMNFILCMVAIPFYFSPYFDWFWVEQNISTGVGEMRRLKLFSYEPSYYALLFTPVFFFFFLQYLFRQSTIAAVWLIPMLFLPYILSFSIGVIGIVLLSGLVTWAIWFRRLTSRKRILNVIINAGVVLVAGLLMVFVFFRDNPIFSRIANIVSGNDSSGNGRTTDAFVLANQILEKRNVYWGVGPGQIKIIGHDTIRDYYMYYMDYAAAIPNAAAETLAVFGWTGFIARFAIELILFVYTKVWNNYYRLLLFLFMFMYQFTGSFITNIAEYVIWILAFTNVFDQFDVKQRKSGVLQPLRE